MSAKPLIGINSDFRPAGKSGAALTWSATGYAEAVIASGGLPIQLPLYYDNEDLKDALSRLDGLVLTGCSGDLDPVRLGLEPHPHTRPMPARREDFDRRICKMAMEMNIPVLAIGSGMQTMNVVCGGALFQHIQEDIPRALHHRDPVEKPNRHIIEIMEGTRLFEIYGPGEIRVNSDHHMSCNDVADRFRVSACSPDGVVEAYESVDDNWFCLGVQWHPEDETASALDMQVFEALIEATREPQADIIPMPQRVAA